jgi:hypothetical protein
MPDLQIPPTDQHAAGPQSDADDALTHLHKMSTTAGLGSTDYVAINGPSVVAVILGLASALAVVDKILLVVPIAGVICSVIALYQIGRSAGTQTGKGLAILGLLLSFGCAAYVGYTHLSALQRARSDRAAIESMIVQLTGHIQKGELDQAYAMFSPRFTERVKAEEFQVRMKYVQDGSWGKLEKITTNGLYDFSSDPTTGIRRAAVIMLMKLDKHEEPSRQEAYFRMVGGQW